MLKAQCDVLDTLNDLFHINVQIGNPIYYNHNWDDVTPCLSTDILNEYNEMIICLAC